MNNIEVLKQALEAMTSTLNVLVNANEQGVITDTLWFSQHETLFDSIEYEIGALRQAIAEAEKQEPVEWMYPDALCDRNCLYLCTKGFTQFPECASSPPPVAKPHKRQHDCTRSHPHEDMNKECELRTEIARLQNKLAQRQPLTDEQISDLWCKVSNTDFVTVDTHEFARAIEAAHGITSKGLQGDINEQ